MPRLSKVGAAALAAFGWTGGASVSASYLVVAGGGGGSGGNGGSPAAGAGGGGAGGYRTSTASLNPTLSYTITVGAGGSAGPDDSLGTNGSDSIFSTITSTGGGRGGASGGVNGATGGSGGGGQGKNSGAGGAGNTPSTSPSQGNNGGAGGTSVGGGGGGGGGATATGTTATSASGGAGGAGTASSITGSSVTYGGGGGGGNQSSGSGGTGGSGGGGTGGTNAVGTAGTANLGGGGGGGGVTGSNSGFAGGAGGSGIVIISYVGAQQFGGGVVTSVGGSTIHTFNTSGTLVPLSSLSASYLIVAGGGGGGCLLGGGGGAGGLQTGSGLTIDTNSTYLVTVGAGGLGSTSSTAVGSNGTSSAFSLVSTSSTGGGGGGSNLLPNGASGASGGGGAGAGGGSTGGVATQGNAGGNSPAISPYPSGGGGGAGAVGGAGSGSVCGSGGAGTASSITGSSVTYAGGGGGSGNSTFPNTVGAGGAGGGGAGNNTSTAGAGTTNSGSGGGGGGTAGGAGGSGIVIISYSGATQLMAGGTVTISGGNVIHTFTSSGYLTPIELVSNSLRFRASATAYLSRTPATASNRKTWTWSGWVKRGLVDSNYRSFFANGNAVDSVMFWNDTSLAVRNFNGTSYDVTTTQLFRDPAAWYHLVIAMDTTQATSSNRIKIYVNGLQVTSFASSSYPSQNYDTGFNTATVQYLGYNEFNYFDGYMTEVNFIDGQALTPNSFGTFNSYGVWQPITYGGSYGINGFYLPFTNTTSATTLAYDFSPQGNNWTPNNISVTAGVTYDSMTDVPTLTSATAANYCVFNPLDKSGTTYIPTISNGNLSFAAGSAVAFSPCRGTLFVSSGKWYFEVTITNNGTYSGQVGVANNYNIYQSGGDNSVSSSGGVGVAWDGRGYLYYAGSAPAFTPTFTTNDVISCAFDADTGKTWFRKNGGSWYDSSGGTTGDPATGANAVYTYTAGTSVAPFANGVSPHTQASNFGQRPFAYTPPTGYVALNTYNL